MKNEKPGDSLQGYLDKIKEAFLIAHKASSAAAENTIGQVLNQLDPEQSTDIKESYLKFGPLRKAELFQAYQEKFKSCKDAFQSGRLKEQFLREFEKACQKLYSMKTRRNI